MLKLDPDDVDSDEDEKSKHNSTLLETSSASSLVNSSSLYQSHNESGISGTGNITHISTPDNSNLNTNTNTNISGTPVKVS